jgi:hypothetical protein
VTGESQWALPLWLDEIDPDSGATYYVCSTTGDAQWDRPPGFVPVVRENPFYTSAETDFVKSVLSPKRSKGACSFTEHLHRTSARTLGGRGTSLSSSMYRMQQAAAQAQRGEGGAAAAEAVAEGDAEDQAGTPRCEVDFGE